MSFFNPLRGLPAAIRSSARLACVPAVGTLRDWSGTVDSSAFTTANPIPLWTRTQERDALAFRGGMVKDIGAVSTYSFVQNTLAFTVFASVDIQGLLADLAQRRFLGNTNTSADKGFFFDYDRATNALRLIVCRGGTSTAATVVGVLTAPSRVTLAAVGNGSDCLFYLNGVYVGSGSLGSVSTGDATAKLCLGGANPIAGTTNDFDLGSCFIGNTALTGAQVATLHDWSQELRSPGRMWNGIGEGFSGATSPVRVLPGCVCALDLGMLTPQGTVPDLSGSGKNGAVRGSVSATVSEVGRGVRFDDHLLKPAVLPGNLSFANDAWLTMFVTIRCSAANAGSYAIASNGLAKGAITRGSVSGTLRVGLKASADGTGRWSTPDVGANLNGRAVRVALVCRPSTQEATLYVDGVPTTMTIGSDGGYALLSSLSGIGIDAYHTTGSPSEAHDYEVYNRQFSAAEIQADYDRFARRCTFDAAPEGWRVSLANEGGAIGQRISNTPFICADTAGRFKVIDDPTAPHGRAIQCVTSGYLKVRFPSAAYGTMDLDYYRGNNIVASRLHFATDATTIAGPFKYYLYIDPNELVQFAVYGAGGLFSTANGAVPQESWCTLRVARRYDGRFWSFIRTPGQPFSPFVAAIGANPATHAGHTSATHMLFDIVAGDRIAGLRRYLGEVLP